MTDFSIIIPAYNNLSLFRSALLSVTIQKEITYDIIVVDDSTNTEIGDYIKSLEINHINYYRNKKPLGAVKNWNYGLSLAKGRYCLVLHHDEKLTDEYHLRKCLIEFAKGNDVVVSNIKVYSNNTIKIGLSNAFFKRFFLKFPSNLFVFNLIGPCACIAFPQNQLQYFDEELCWLVDSEWYYRMLQKKRIVFLNNLYISSYHGHSGQITNQINIKEKEKQDIKVITNKYARNIAVKFSLILHSVFKLIKH